MSGRIFLAGGGSRQSSFHIDEAFAAAIDRTGPLVYIPVAMVEHPYAACLSWLGSVFAPFGITEIVMWTDAAVPPVPLAEASGVYIGGGDTVNLLNWTHRNGADARLCAAIDAGVPVYGGSAGAILLGADIRTAPEAGQLPRERAQGIGLLNGYSVYCHYQSDEMIYHLVNQLDTPLIALPETAGVCLVDDQMRVYGTAPVDVLTRLRSYSVYPGATFCIG